MMHIRSRPSCGGGDKAVVLNLGVALDDVRYPRVKKFGRHDRCTHRVEVPWRYERYKQGKPLRSGAGAHLCVPGK